MTLLLVAAAIAASPAGAFACSLDQVAALNYSAGQANASMIEGLPSDSLKFQLVFKGDEATIQWPNSPVQASGKQTILTTGPGAGMILSVSQGPCLFTEANCASMLNFAQQPDGSMRILMTPTALTYDKDHNTRSPFVVWMSGRCAQASPAK